MKRHTIDDVARLANVGRGTVSRVLNDQPGVSNEKRQRVLDVVKSLNYQANPVARSLKNSRTGTIGCIIDTLRGYTQPRVLEGAVRCAQSNGYSLIITEAKLSDDGEPVWFNEQMNPYVEGVLILYPGARNDTYRLESAFPKNVPIVTTGYRVHATTNMVCRIDNPGGTFAGINSLINQGRTKILMITGPRDHNDVIDRTNGYLDAHRDNGLSVDLSRILEGDWSVQCGYTLIRTALSAKKRFDAVFAQNDWMALGAMKALDEQGVRIPDDVMILGFNDTSFAKYTSPSLSTVRYPARALGEYAVKQLLNMMAAERGEEDQFKLDNQILVPDLIHRESTSAGDRGMLIKD